MRKYAKSMAVMAVLAMALSCFAAGKVVTKWKTVVDSDRDGYLIFYSNSVVKLDTTDKKGNVLEGDFLTGTYTGNTKKDGTVTVMLDKLDEIIAEISGNTLVCDGGRSKTVFTKVIN